jgi:hypothetical protein
MARTTRALLVLVLVCGSLSGHPPRVAGATLTIIEFPDALHRPMAIQFDPTGGGFRLLSGGMPLRNDSGLIAIAAAVSELPTASQGVCPVPSICQIPIRAQDGTLSANVFIYTSSTPNPTADLVIRFSTDSGLVLLPAFATSPLTETGVLQEVLTLTNVTGETLTLRIVSARDTSPPLVEWLVPLLTILLEEE